MTVAIKGKIVVQTVKPNPEVLGRHLSNMPEANRILLTLANAVVDQAQQNLLSTGGPGRGKVIYPVYLGRRWSAKPGAVAKLISVKDRRTKVFNLHAPKVAPAGVTRVALVVADHPYSWPYEFGGMGIKASGFMRKAIREIAAAATGVKLRRYRKPAGAP